MSMQAIQVLEPGPASGLGLATIPIPKLTLDHDILVRVRAVALNPADTKWRDKEGRLLGFDASGIVEEAGPQARFKKGDEVLYAGSFIRPGSNAQYQLVDARIVGHKPSTIDWVEAAALPLVNLTAWETFEDHFNLKPDGTNANEILLIVNGAGGVGTAAIQLARKVFGIKTVIATASRPETVEWVKKLGATHVVDHRKELGPQLKELGLEPTLALVCHDAARYVPILIPLVRAFGRIASIVGAQHPLDDTVARTAFIRSLAIHYEYMFAKSMWGHQLETQGAILDRVGELAAKGELDAGITRREVLSVASLVAGHEFQASGKSYGKIAYEMPDTLA